MQLSIAINTVIYYIILMIVIVLSFFKIGIYIVPILLFIMLYILTILTPLHLSWEKEMPYGSIVRSFVIYIFFAILIYAIMYFKSGLIINGKLIDVDFLTSIYFSGTTWTTVGYGDISAPKNIRILTTIEAINSYFAMAILVSIIVSWFNDVRSASKEYLNWIRSSSKEDIEKVTGINFDDLEKEINKKKK
ncbi:ion channel [Arcobacter sp. KX21116]|uniref:ion channel n=1 Tax=Arcobacter iocasae TaxID=2906515 RepID=UPI0035D41503